MMLDSQGSSIGPMTMMCCICLQLPKKYSSPGKQHVGGLNYEAIVSVRFPSPAWIKTTEYTALQPQTHDDETWEDEADDNTESNGEMFNYTIAPFMVWDWG